MDFTDNRRHHQRYHRHADRTLSCYSCDASVHGLKVELENEIPVDSMVDLWVAFEANEGKLYLRGHICWCYEMGGEDEHFQLGIELDNAYATDYEHWVSLLESAADESELT